MDFSQNETSPLRKFSGLGIVVLVHIIGAYFLITGLASRMIETIKGPVETKVIEDKTPPPPPPPDPVPPPPKIAAPPPPFIPPPEVPVTTNVPPPITNTTAQQPPKQDFTKTTPPVDAPVAPKPNLPATPSFSDLNACKPDYPRASRMAEEQGTVKVRIEVDANGQFVKAAVVESSGFKNLDRATQNAFSRCKFHPGYKDGQAVDSSFDAVYVWKLED
jgi:periplasmic protein TonB